MFTAKNLFFGYNRTQLVIRGVTLILSPRTWTLMIGPNGSGKSTLLRILDGYLRPQRGLVQWNDQDIFQIPARKRARILGYLPQISESLFPYTVREIAEMGCWARTPGPWIRSTPKDQVIIEAVLRDLGLQDLADRPLTQLSGGERQLAFLARLWVLSPQFYLLDEPIRNLDMEHRARIWRLLFQLKQAGKGGIIVIHELHFPRGFFDWIVALHNGKILWQGTPETVLKPEKLQSLYGTLMRVQSDRDWIILPQLGR